MLVRERVPLAAPADCGANTTLKLGLLWPEAKVKGRLKPFTVNPLPVTAACVMVTLEPPELLRVSAMLRLFPVCTLPKLRLDGFAVRAPCVTPVPDKGILSVGLEALLLREREPLAAPADCGAKTTLKLGLLCPGAKVKGKFKPFTVNPLPVTVACVMVTLEPPELLRVSARL